MAENSKTTLEKVVDLYAEGGADVEVARLLGLSMKKFYELVEENSSFADVVERGRTFSQAWWMEAGRRGLFADKFNASVYALSMKNRFGWADKVETGDKASSMTVNADEAQAQLRHALKKLSKTNPELLQKAMEDGE